MRAPNRVGRVGLVALISGVAALSYAPGSAAAANYAVNTTADLNDPNGCISIPECSLREATLAADGGSGGDTITVPPGTYPLAPANGQLYISAPPTTITSAAARPPVIDRGAATRPVVATQASG